MALSAFTDKGHPPSGEELRAVLGSAHPAWNRLIELVAGAIPPIAEEWGFASAKTGWGLRLRRNGRVILYMTPAAGHFLVGFALGEKAVGAAEALPLPAPLLEQIAAAPKYAEGRGVRFEVRTARQLPPLVDLARIKNEH